MKDNTAVIGDPIINADVSTTVPTWKINELRSLIENLHGIKAAESLDLYLQSIAKKLYISAYHSWESRNLFDKFFVSDDAAENYEKGFALLFGSVTGNIPAEVKDKSNEFHKNTAIAEAHVIAYAHSMMSVIDIMAQVINIALDIKIDINDVTIFKMKNRVSNYVNIHKEISELLNYYEYDYLKAFVNCQKHISLVHSDYCIDATLHPNKRSHGLKISCFNYKSKKTNKNTQYPNKWAHDFVTDDFTKLESKLLMIGNELNLALGSNC